MKKFLNLTDIENEKQKRNQMFNINKIAFFLNMKSDIEHEVRQKVFGTSIPPNHDFFLIKSDFAEILHEHSQFSKDPLEIDIMWKSKQNLMNAIIFENFTYFRLETKNEINKERKIKIFENLEKYYDKENNNLLNLIFCNREETQKEIDKDRSLKMLFEKILSKFSRLILKKMNRILICLLIIQNFSIENGLKCLTFLNMNLIKILSENILSDSDEEQNFDDFLKIEMIKEF